MPDADPKTPESPAVSTPRRREDLEAIAELAEAGAPARFRVALGYLSRCR